tara:strand:- start:152 stop:457 length:306 start_codon:yes stop_codon:yes gene_type:complete
MHSFKSTTLSIFAIFSSPTRCIIHSSSSHLVDDSRWGTTDRTTRTSTVDGDDVVDVVRASVVAASRQRRVRAMVRDRARRRGRERDIRERRARPARAETLG